MSTYPKVILANGKDHSLRRFHPWVFSGAIKRIEGEPQEGDIVEVFSNKGEYLGTGHAQPGSSIAVRVFSFVQGEISQQFFTDKIRKAYDYRRQAGITGNPQTDSYRLVFAEGDGLPGLIIDRYHDTAVMQAHSLGMHQHRHQITKALQEVIGPELKAIYDKSRESLPPKAAANTQNGYLFGQGSDAQVAQENGHKFLIDWEGGQKTGFFLDQRDNRALLATYSKGKRVLNTFCYTGGFSVYALAAGAELVHSVDVSKKAIELTDRNVALNGLTAPHESFAIDTFEFLKDKHNQYDVIVLDPPAFAKSQNVRHNALMGYKRLNAEAIAKIKPGGILFTFSCSGVVSPDMFNSTVMAAAIEAGRQVRVMHHLSQPADHPVSIFHPEGEYLKGLVLFVE